MKKIVLAMAIGAICSSVAFADVAKLYQPCAVCHGKEGEKVALGKSLIIKDMTKAEFIASMKGYQDGTYGGPLKATMTSVVKKLSDKDIEEMADMICKK